MSFKDVSNKFKIKNSTPKTAGDCPAVLIYPISLNAILQQFFQKNSNYPFTNQ